VGVRGTDWLTKADKENTVVHAYENSLYVKGIKKDGSLTREETVIPAGHMTSIGRFQKPQAPQRLPDQARMKWSALKNDMRRHADEAIVKRGPLGRMRNSPRASDDGRANGPHRPDELSDNKPKLMQDGKDGAGKPKDRKPDDRPDKVQNRPKKNIPKVPAKPSRGR